MANANRTLHEILQARSTPPGLSKWTWAEVMERALYDPEIGYYRHKLPQIGKAGDFYTSVSVGRVFGQLLGAFIFHRWRERGSPRPFHVIEQGAHRGTLAKDVWQALLECDPSLLEDLHYWVVEPSPEFQGLQRETLQSLPLQNLHHVETWSALPSASAFFLCNELLDAFAVHRVQWHAGSWQELYVAWDRAEAWEWTLGPLSSPELETACAQLGEGFAEGYQTEVHLAANQWMQQVATSPFEGDMLIFDYGYTEAEYYAPERRDGTLRRYYQHQSDGKVLEDLGEADLTAHVNFSAVAREAERFGLEIFEFVEQGRFLTQVATQHVLKPESPPDQAWVRQFLTLTHPSHLGHSFRVLGLSKASGSEDRPLASVSQVARARLGLTTEF